MILTANQGIIELERGGLIMAELKDLTNHDSVRDQIKQYSNLISLTADNLQDLKARIKSLDNGSYDKELDAINQAQQHLYQALKDLEIE